MNNFIAPLLCVGSLAAGWALHKLLHICPNQSSSEPQHNHDWGMWERCTIEQTYMMPNGELVTGQITGQKRHCSSCGQMQSRKV